MTMHFTGSSLLKKLTFACALALAVPATAFAAPATITGPPTVGETGKATYTFTCGTTGAPPLEAPATGAINYKVTGGTAVADADFTKPADGSVNCALGTPVPATLEVTIKEDAVDEPNETFSVEVASVSGTVVIPAAPKVNTQIVDDDVPTATIAASAAVPEGNTGQSNAEILVTLTQQSWQEITIPYSTQDYNAVAGQDYTATSGDLKIPAGQTTGTIAVPVLGDTSDEAIEGFFVNLGTPVGAQLDNSKKQGLIVIGDDDDPAVPEISIGDNQRVTEGNEGTVNMIFTVTLSTTSAKEVRVSWKTENFTATLGDYAGGAGDLVFAPGETSKQIQILVKGDTRKEEVEAFAVTLKDPVNATLKKANAAGIIDDDDSGSNPPPATNGPKVAIATPSRDGKRVFALLTCPADVSGCKGTLTLTSGTLKVGRAKFDIDKGLSSELKVKLSRRALAVLRRRALRVTFTAVAKNVEGATGSSTRGFRIRKTPKKRPRR
jgi:Calx-beta domain